MCHITHRIGSQCRYNDSIPESSRHKLLAGQSPHSIDSILTYAVYYPPVRSHDSNQQQISTPDSSAGSQSSVGSGSLPVLEPSHAGHALLLEERPRDENGMGEQIVDRAIGQLGHAQYDSPLSIRTNEDAQLGTRYHAFA